MNRRSKILKSPKLIEKKRAKIIRITLIYLLCLVVVISGTFFTLRLDNLQITRINSNVSYSNEIANKVNEIISDNYLYLFPKSNIWLYPKSDIKKFEHNLGGEFEIWLLNNRLSSSNATVMYYLASEFDEPKTYKQIADATGISIEYLRVIATRLKIEELKPPFQIVKSAHKATRAQEATLMLTKKSTD
jgi:hypothetical protein